MSQCMVYWGWGPLGYSVQLDPHTKSVYIGGGGHLSQCTEIGFLIKGRKESLFKF